MIDRFDKHGNQIQIGDKLRHFGGSICSVVFQPELIAIGLMDEDGEFDFMSEWVAEEWEIIRE